MNLNRVFIAGNLTRDPELKYIPNNTAVVQIGLAVNHRYKDGQGKPQEEVTFIDCEAWGQTAENIAKHFCKGKPIFIEGRLKLDQWDDKATGQKRTKLKVSVTYFQFVGGKNDQGGASAPAPTRTGANPNPAAGTYEPIREDDQIPFDPAPISR